MASTNFALAPAFAAIEGKGARWSGFVRWLPGTSAPPDLEAVIQAVPALAAPVPLALDGSQPFDKTWTPRGPW